MEVLVNTVLSAPCSIAAFIKLLFILQLNFNFIKIHSAVKLAYSLMLPIHTGPVESNL